MFIETKAIKTVQHYHWHQMNLFTRWLPRTKQLVIIFFDAAVSLQERIPEILSHPEPCHSTDPFWVYSRLFTEVAHWEDEAVWALRNLVRDVEKQVIPADRPQPDYRQLHDIARHAIHVTETLEVISDTMIRVLDEHDAFTKRHNFAIAQQAGNSTCTAPVADNITTVHEKIHRRLCFLQHFIVSQKQRSIANEKRLQNELQLAFNIVAQHDAYISVQIGRAAQADSAATRTIAMVTLAFLPSTFVSSIFSMSFFTYSNDVGWIVSDRFWLYWAFAAPITLVSFLLWYWWQSSFLSTAGGAEAKVVKCPRGESVKSGFGLKRIHIRSGNGALDF